MTIPHNHDAERSVLGAMMSSPEAIADVIDTLSPEDFFSDEHRSIFSTICDLYQRGESADSVSVGKDRSIDKNLLFDCLQSYSTIGATKSHAEAIRSDAILRGLIRAGSEIVELAQTNGDAGDKLDKAEGLVFDLADRSVRSEVRPVGHAVKGALEFIERGKMEGLSTGFSTLDEHLTLCPGRFYIVAARPAVGKSALLGSIALSVARTEGTAALFTLEMTEQEMVVRFLSSIGQVDSHAIRSGRLDGDQWKELTNAAASLSDLPLYMDDSSNLSLLKLRAKCRRIKAKHGLKLIVVDYLQLMAAHKGDNREREVAEISRGLKLLAKDLSVPVVIASQLNRQTEYRNDKRPRLSDLRESGAQEMDADVVLLLHREGLYDATVDPADTELIVAKNRHGPVGKVLLGFEDQYTRFVGGVG